MAPKDRPRTSWRCATHPARMTGRVAIVAAAATIATLPVVLAGWIAQRQLVRGLSFGAIK